MHATETNHTYIQTLFDELGVTVSMGCCKEAKAKAKAKTEIRRNNGAQRLLWKKVKYELVEYDHLPGYLRDNEYIKHHYRADWPLKQTFFSIFTLHNETLNVWTHLIGFFLFLWLTIYTSMKIPEVVNSDCFQHHLPDVFKNQDFHSLQGDLLTSLPDRISSKNHTELCISSTMTDDLPNTIASFVRKPITRWPFFAFLGGAMFCLLASTTCHLLCCHSERLSSITLRVDYAGITSLITTSFYPLVYYSFLCQPFFQILYMGFITVLGFSTVVFSLSPAFQKTEFRVLRAVLFSGLSVSGVVPILHKQILFWDQPEAMYTTGYEILMGVFYALGALFYATRIPERWMPGVFDIAGHSHQLFHVLVVAGAYSHYCAGLVYLNWRDSEGC